MPQHAEDIQPYGLHDERLPKGWRVIEGGGDPLPRYLLCDHNDSVESAHMEAPDLQSALDLLKSPEFQMQSARIREGRERRFLATMPAVANLCRALRSLPVPERGVEAFLDELFSSLREGEEFQHTEAVMALLYALRTTGSEAFDSIAEPIASSRAAEVGRLGRFARSLLLRS